ncbi:4Fe-4S dicluster domain-containing protein [Marinisporobacter balticus]|uniref:Heterodisulfide reductase subunit C n=1 Tax=Marinisporobacter balticus TaxID=2018667 RepID=A0A4R2KHP0_9FIRM|nr:4Fe-4S dicluster domain-containing protein [Marinisporobacter balticus]TCO70016.1 heterodisulfide reductase subunit C [Marinisporobacter balticus]
MTRVKVIPENKKNIIDKIIEMSGENIRDCMQCGKCSAGCPASDGMDLLPHQVIRLLQLGQIDRIVESKSIWNCASCFTCAQRCPRNIDIANIMEAIRLTIIRCVGNSRLKADDVPSKVDCKMPQQAIVSGFRKYNK